MSQINLAREFEELFDRESHSRSLTVLLPVRNKMRHNYRLAAQEVTDVIGAGKMSPEHAMNQSIGDLVRFIDRLENVARDLGGHQIDESVYHDAKAQCGLWPWCGLGDD